MKTVIHNQARDMAPRLNIRTLDERELEVLEKTLALNTINIGIADLQIYTKAHNVWGIDIMSGIPPTEKELAVKNVYDYLKYQYWVVEDYRTNLREN